MISKPDLTLKPHVCTRSSLRTTTTLDFDRCRTTYLPSPAAFSFPIIIARASACKLPLSCVSIFNMNRSFGTVSSAESWLTYSHLRVVYPKSSHRHTHLLKSFCTQI